MTVPQLDKTDRYVLGLMDAAERAAFEEAQRRDAALAREVELRLIEQEIRHVALGDNLRASMSRWDTRRDRTKRYYVLFALIGMALLWGGMLLWRNVSGVNEVPAIPDQAPAVFPEQPPQAAVNSPDSVAQPSRVAYDYTRTARRLCLLQDDLRLSNHKSSGFPTASAAEMALEEEQWAEAVRQFRLQEATDSTSVNQLLFGYALFKVGNYPEAAKRFRQAKNKGDSFFADEAGYMLALSILASGDPRSPEIKKLLSELAQRYADEEIGTEQIGQGVLELQQLLYPHKK